MTQQDLKPAWRVGVDTGGTFTDLLLQDPDGVIRAQCKVLSTPDDPGRAVLDGIDALLDRFSGKTTNSVAGSAGQAKRLTRASLRQVVHGSTVATNALLEQKIDDAVLITTAGFEDLLQLARQDRPDLYALAPRRDDPPIRRGRIIGVDERLAFDGQVITPLSQHQIDAVIEWLREIDITSVVVCLLHSYANDQHERLLAQAIRDALPGMHLTVSSELLPEMREYERAATCTVNAVVGPTMSRYIGGLDEALGDGRLRVMASGGGTLPPAVVSERPVETVVSGPAGGVIGACAMARSANEQRVITFDMGGTSTDVSLCDGGPSYTNEMQINAMPIRLPVIDIHTVGAGGGSLAWIDSGGALRVGPESAGADPGPACYGRQGENPSKPTVTDAHAVLGHLREGRPLGESMSVDRMAARQAVDGIAQQLGRSIEDTAEGILRVADAQMARAVQRVSVQRGRDARDHTLVAFGGAGGLHACRLSQVLGMTRVLAPVYGGVLSALGMLAAPPRYDYSHAVLRRFQHDDQRYPDPMVDHAVVGAIDQLTAQADQALEADQVLAEERTLRVSFDLRFEGQSYEITVPVLPGESVIDRFMDEHRQLYGYVPQGRAIELVTARIEALGPTPVLRMRRNEAATDVPSVDGDDAVDVYEAGQYQVWRRIDRATLESGVVVMGPAVIEEYTATTLVLRGWSARVLDDGQLLMEVLEA